MKKILYFAVAVAALGYLSYHTIRQLGGSGGQLFRPELSEDAASPNTVGSETMSSEADVKIKKEDSAGTTAPKIDSQKDFSENPLTKVKGDSPHLEKHANWPDARVISVWEEKLPKNGVRRVSLVQPTELPNPVRIEEVFREDSTLVRRTEMVANRFVLRLKGDSITALENYASASGSSLRKISSIGLYRVEMDSLTPDGVPNSIRQILNQLPEVDYAEPDYISRGVGSP